MSPIWGEGSDDHMLKSVPLADGIGSDSGLLAISDETEGYLDLVLAAAALPTSGLRGASS